MPNLPRLLQAISFSAKKHRFQRRKGGDAEPYINHPIEVANLIASVGNVTDLEILMAAVLHDTIEDTETTAEELTELFGENVCGMVLEVTDDKSLPKQRRKELQIEHSPHLSFGAKHVKLGDKISNITDVLNNPPADWSSETKSEYIAWAGQVVDGLRGINKELEDYFDNLVASAK
ncbi:MAG TPA: HD domain-containing protein [Pyrinomonadaceae bacterium]|nr:HD domain-containing protein [Pyrinomonadaceae bacterium]